MQNGTNLSVFNLETQNTNLDNKIVAGLERLSHVYRILLWQKANEHKLSPIQIQILIFIKNHPTIKATVSTLAQEFNLTKPTVSDAVKILDQKALIIKNIDNTDTRSYFIQLTDKGENIVMETEHFVNPITTIVSMYDRKNKIALWQIISDLILQLHKLEVINVQRTCVKCEYYFLKNHSPFCKLLKQKLQVQDIRIDCPDFVINRSW